jgi:hypothetical protein
MRRIGLVVILAVSFALAPLGVGAQSPPRVPRVGVLNPQTSAEPATVQREPFEQGLRELGWAPGRASSSNTATPRAGPRICRLERRSSSR